METLPCLRHPQPWHSPGGAWRPASEVHDLFHPPRAVCSAYSLSSLSLALPMPRWCSMKLTVVNVQVFCDLTCGCCCLSVRHWVSTCLCEVAMSSRCRQRERERDLHKRFSPTMSHRLLGAICQDTPGAAPGSRLPGCLGQEPTRPIKLIHNAVTLCKITATTHLAAYDAKRYWLVTSQSTSPALPPND